MLRFFENLVDPYADHGAGRAVPSQLIPFLLEYLRPFRKVAFLIVFFTAIVAAMEIGMIWYAGRLVDALSETGPTEVWNVYGTELILIALALLIVRVLSQRLRTWACLPSCDRCGRLN